MRFAPATLEEWRNLDSSVRFRVAAGARRRLTLNPTRVDPHWIVRLTEPLGPTYRLRFGPLRIFYDVRGREVWVLLIATLPRLEPVWALRRQNTGSYRAGPKRFPTIGGRMVRAMALTEVKKDLSKCMRMAAEEPLVITRHGRVAGLLVAFSGEEEWLEYRLRHEPGFLDRIESARRALRSAREAAD